MDAAHLHEAIAEVCPVVSVSVGDENDRVTWTWIPGAEATQAQIDAGNNVVATIPVELKTTVSSGEFIARFTNAEYLALEKKRRDDIAANKIGNAKNWDIVIADGTIDMNKKKAQTLKADLIADGVITAARADEIFS